MDWKTQCTSKNGVNSSILALLPISFLTVTKNCGQNKKHSYLNALKNDLNQSKTEGMSTPRRMEQHWVSFPHVHSL